MKSKFLLTMILSLFFVTGAGSLNAQNELPKAEVLSLGMTVVDEHYVMPNWNSNPVTDDLNVPVAMEFIALDTPEQAAQNHYAGYTTDFFITFSGLSGESITADDDCYLIGNYGPFGWIKIPVGGLVLGNNVTYPILTPSGFNFTYVAICESVVDFKCGIGISEAILTANPNMKVTLELGLSESPEQAQAANFIRVGDAYTYDVRNLRGQVAMVGSTSYSSVQDAIANAADGAEVDLISSVTIDQVVNVNSSVTIDLNGNEIVGTGDRMFRLNNNSKSGEREVITYRDGTIRNIEDKGRCIETRTGNIELVLDNMVLETTCKGATQPLTIGGSGDNIVVDIDNSTITSGDLGYAVIIFNPVTMTIDNSSITGWSAVYFKQPSSSLGAAGSVCTINNSTLRGVNKASEHPSNAFATIAIQDNDIEVNVTGNSTIVYADETNSNSQCAFGIGGENITEQLSNDLVINVANGVTMEGHILGFNDAQQLQDGANIVFPAEYADELRAAGYIVEVVGNQVKVTGIAEGEAYIGTTYYETLEEAIAAANADDDEDEVVLLNDVTIESKIDVTKSLVLNGNNKTLTYTGSDRAIDVRKETNGADLTVKNLSVQFEGNYRERGINYNTTGKLTLENVTVGSADKHPTYAVNLPGSCDNATIDIDGCEFYGKNTFNVWGENCTITIDGTKITSVDNANSENYVAVILNNDATTSAEGTVITINGGSIVVATDENGNPSAAVRNNTETGVINISESTEIIGGTTESSVAIVYYNGTDNVYSCLTLQRAINKAIESNAAGVKLIKNVTSDEIITIDGNLNLDLNSKTVTGTANRLFRITKASAIVTITNGTIENNVAQGRCIETRAGGINLTLENLTLNTTGNQSQPFTVGGNSGTDGNVIVNMKETNVNAGINNSYAITTFNPVVMTIEDSSVEGWAALNIKAEDNSLGSAGSVFTINDSQISSLNVAPTGDSNSFGTFKIEDEDITINITGETSIAQAESVNNKQYIFAIGNYPSTQIQGDLNINIASGVQLISDDGILFFDDGQDFDIVIGEGGITVPAEYANQLRSEGYIVEVNGNTASVTGVAEDEAYIGTTYYGTLEAAIAAAQTGDEVVLLKNVSLSSSVSVAGKNITLNLNGKTITANFSDSYGAIYVKKGAELTIKGEGNITSTGIVIGTYGTVNIQGGNITTTNANVEESTALYVFYYSSDFEGVANISGGRLNRVWNCGTLNITGGIIDYLDTSSELTIGADAEITTMIAKDGADAGGPYEMQIADINVIENITLEEGYILVEVGEDVYQVVPNNAEALIGTTSYSTLEAAIAVANADDDEDEVVLLKDVTIESKIDVTESLVLNGNNKTLTYTGSDRAIDVRKETNGANLTVRNLTINCAANWCERGINYNTTGTLTLDGVTIEGKTIKSINYGVNFPGYADGATAIIENSKITNFMPINIWGSNMNVTIIDSEIYSYSTSNDAGGGIVLNIDAEHSAEGTQVYMIGGKLHAYFIDDENNYTPGYAVRKEVNNTTLVNISNTTDVYGTIENGLTVATVRYGDSPYFYSYETLKEAVEKAILDYSNGITNVRVEVVKDAEGSGIFIEKDLNLNLTIDFKNHTYTFTEPAVGSTGTESQGFHIEKNNTITLKNGTLNVDYDYRDKFYILIQNYANLTLENMNLDGTNLDKWSLTDGDSYTLSNNSGNVNIINSTIKDNDEGDLAVAFDVCKYANYEVPVVQLDSESTIEGIVEHTGGQLFTAQDINVKYVKKVEGTITGWGTISSPVGTVAHENVTNLLNGTHDYYRYNEANMEWENVKVTENGFTSMEAGRGYLYANTATTNVVFNGLLKAIPSSVKMNLGVTANALPGFHMVGNPFAHNINENNFSTTNSAQLANGFYVISEEGAWVAKTTETIAPMESVLIKTSAETELSINPTAASKSRSVNNGQLEIKVSNANYSDVAYVSFNKGIGLDKISHRNANIPMISVPVNGTDYAVAIMSKDVTEIPVSFVAKTMGEYTISVEAQDCEFAQMYLIDRMTGYSTNLLLEDYTFMATSKDNADRFIIRLVNSFDQGFGAENFVIFSNDEMMINDIQGEGVIRIVDVLGRPVAEYNVFGSANISTTSFRSGAYMIQVIDESGVKVQKIIID